MYTHTFFSYHLYTFGQCLYKKSDDHSAHDDFLNLCLIFSSLIILCLPHSNDLSSHFQWCWKFPLSLAVILFGITVEAALKSEQSDEEMGCLQNDLRNQVIKTHKIYTTGIFSRIPKIPVVFYLKLMEEDVYIANCSIIWFLFEVHFRVDTYNDIFF